jgi:hypothetical protein
VRCMTRSRSARYNHVPLDLQERALLPRYLGFSGPGTASKARKNGTLLPGAPHAAFQGCHARHVMEGYIIASLEHLTYLGLVSWRP